jgi:hypothetical protein
MIYALDSEDARNMPDNTTDTTRQHRDRHHQHHHRHRAGRERHGGRLSQGGHGSSDPLGRLEANERLDPDVVDRLGGRELPPILQIVK